MHYLAYVLIPADGDPETHVERLMAPHKENYGEEDDEGDCSRSGFWDWWQIGGRWTGFLSGKDPAKDARNLEVCLYCRGTPGIRYDLDPAGKPCNGCTYGENADLPPGVRLKWPTQWVKDLGDVLTMPIDLPDDKLPYTLVLEGKVSHKESWNGKDWLSDPEHAATVRQALGAHVGRLVIVDYHS